MEGGGFELLAPRLGCLALQQYSPQLGLLECTPVGACVFLVAGIRAFFPMVMSRLAAEWSSCLGYRPGNVGVAKGNTSFLFFSQCSPAGRVQDLNNVIYMELFNPNVRELRMEPKDDHNWGTEGIKIALKIERKTKFHHSLVESV